ncbi:unnamed protein product [Rhizophagus irregularis]|nr:unnamed protein product [Rhizophagus irregularis]
MTKNDEIVLKYLKSLQYNFKIPKFKSIEETGSVKSFGSFASTTSSARNFNSKNTIKNNLIRTPTKSEIPKFERLLLRMSVANVSDSAPAYAAARRCLQLEYAEIVFLPCFAHQCQLAIGDIFKESSILKTASTLRNLAIRYEHPQIGSGDELYLNSELCQILLDNDWMIFDILL